MARIRSIKPEFPQSESMGKVSRDARLLFIQLWTIADDSGRLRAASRMLASLLFPYDDDAPGLIDGWLQELESVDCIIRYKHDNQTYLEICNWLQHQKIDKPSESKIPKFDESSRILSNPLESSPLERIGEEGIGIGGEGILGDSVESQPKKKKSVFAKPEIAEIAEYCKERKNGIDAEHFFHHYEARGWKLNNGKLVTDWKSCVITWEKNNEKFNGHKALEIGLGGNDQNKDYSLPDEYKNGGTW